MYLLVLTGAILTCAGLSKAVPALARPMIIAVVVLLGATAFAPGLAPGLRILAGILTLVVGLAAVGRLRTGVPTH
jgi:hypothetical protein